MLAVAVEGILTAEPIGVPNGPRGIETEADIPARAYWTMGTVTHPLPREPKILYRRCLNQLLKDRLYTLRDAGVIDEKLIAAWNRIRNKAAHGHPPAGDDLQPWLNDCAAVTALLYRLIATAIGYKGKLTDYTRRHWPLVAFPPTVDGTPGLPPAV